MEIRCVSKSETEYPKINAVSEKKIKHSIPNRWLKLGVTTFISNLIMKSKVFASSYDVEVAPLPGSIMAPTPGSVQYYEPTYEYIKHTCTMISAISTMMLIISTLVMIVKRTKKQEKNVKSNKIIKIIFITSILLMILSTIGVLIYNYIYG